jgi:hypothetical protein
MSRTTRSGCSWCGGANGAAPRGRAGTGAAQHCRGLLRGPPPQRGGALHWRRAGGGATPGSPRPPRSPAIGAATPLAPDHARDSRPRPRPRRAPQACDPVDILLVKRDGRFNGEAYVVLASPSEIQLALDKNKSYLGRRYVEVFKAKKLVRPCVAAAAGPSAVPGAGRAGGRRAARPAAGVARCGAARRRRRARARLRRVPRARPRPARPPDPRPVRPIPSAPPGLLQGHPGRDAGRHRRDAAAARGAWHGRRHGRQRWLRHGRRRRRLWHGAARRGGRAGAGSVAQLEPFGGLCALAQQKMPHRARWQQAAAAAGPAAAPEL